MDLDRIKADYQGQVFDETTFTVNAQTLVAYARACGERSGRFTNPDDADFQAVPTFVSSFQARRRLPKGFPKLPGMGMDGGKVVTVHAPLRAGQTVTGRTHIEDVYAKTGRSGTMTFIVLRMNIFTADEQLIASADTNMVIRERAQKQKEPGEESAS
ncbi:MAG: MaoC family dehydratase N-terminal domain-containing protein [Pseudomonadota bacterium]